MARGERLPEASTSLEPAPHHMCHKVQKAATDLMAQGDPQATQQQLNFQKDSPGNHAVNPSSELLPEHVSRHHWQRINCLP